MQKSHDLTKKQFIEILVVTTLLGLGILVYDFVNTNVGFDGVIERNDAGAGSVSEDLELGFSDQKQEYEIEVSDRRLSEKEIEKSFDKAIQEIEETYLGQNKSANNVTYDLVLETEYVDGLIEASWKLSPYGIISRDGKIKVENIPEGGELVDVQCTLYYEEAERIYSFSVLANRKGMDTLDGQLEAIDRTVKELDESTREKSEYVLPKEISGMELSWKKKMNFRGLQIIFLGILTVAGLAVGKKQDEKKARQMYIDELAKDYPQIVSQLSILMGAGMSLRKALERISGKYVLSLKKGEKQKAGYEEILKTYRKINDGRGEIQALEELGKSCECKEYRKLTMLLVQNLRKGSRDLLDSLEKEEENAFDMRKQRAIRAGEEASTKLLIPMGGMLFIVIIVLVVPAIMQIN
ncbi:type II secretion system F family protein [Pseudobutyrivibrio xylanivorans]|uniref:Type II secretion system protein F (GspF) n=1 Tax=Pseudobutyrivibrio xylanivorans DSM 14809 TaxID=1123012 RepID=A0A1M6H6U0_PSEXY|nr:type II secretion system F family protein [Pseudobutyrivibrio xylanivorans]SHJ17930.1 type II secretion system protein F (GspF) [Pseudobutyrivibrio xylanivorans DSM 14809]